MSKDVPVSQNKDDVLLYENKLKTLREDVIEAISDSMALYGVSSSNAHLYGTLLFSEKPMTLDEMGNALEMSKTSMCTGVKSLMNLRMVNKVWKKGNRKDHYEVEHDWHRNFVDFFDVEWRDTAKNCISALEGVLSDLISLKEKKLPDTLIESINSDIEKIEYAIGYYDWLVRLTDFFKSKEVFKYVPKKV